MARCSGSPAPVVAPVVAGPVGPWHVPSWPQARLHTVPLPWSSGCPVSAQEIPHRRKEIGPIRRPAQADDLSHLPEQPGGRLRRDMVACASALLLQSAQLHHEIASDSVRCGSPHDLRGLHDRDRATDLPLQLGASAGASTRTSTMRSILAPISSIKDLTSAPIRCPGSARFVGHTGESSAATTVARGVLDDCRSSTTINRPGVASLSPGTRAAATAIGTTIGSEIQRPRQPSRCGPRVRRQRSPSDRCGPLRRDP